MAEVDEFTDVLWCAYDNAVGLADRKSLADYHGPGLLAVARVALERAAAYHIDLAEQHEACDDKDSRHREWAKQHRADAERIRAMIPKETT